MKNPAPYHEQGFSIVEMMVAVAIGLFVTTVVLVLYLGNRQTFGAQDSQSRLQENVRYGSALVAREIRLAGYRTSPVIPPGIAFPATARAIGGTEGASGANDQITVRFQGSSDTAGNADGTLIDCRGQRVPGGTVSSNTFAVRTTGAADGGPALFCSTDDGTSWVEVVPEVEAMQARYGEDTDGDKTANYYVPANLVGDWDNVVAVQMGLLFRTADQSRVRPDTSTYPLAGTTVSHVSDSRLRQAVNLTITLRNRAP